MDRLVNCICLLTRKTLRYEDFEKGSNQKEKSSHSHQSRKIYYAEHELPFHYESALCFLNQDQALSNYGFLKWRLES